MSVLDGISEFVAVAETGSFTSASKKLRISVAQVSRQVSAVEERLKIKLFRRTTRKVSLTESGAIYYERCRKILDDLTEAQDITTSLHNKLSGKIRLSAPITYGEEVITPIVNDFLLAYPDIKIHLDLNNARADLINDGYDLAIRMGKLDDSRLIARKLSTRTLYVCAAPTYLAQNGTPSSVKQLQAHNCLIGTADHWHFQHQGKGESVKVNGTLRCNSGHGLINAALKSIGIIQLPDYYVQPYIDSGELRILLEEYQAPNEGIWAVYPDRNFLPLKTSTFIDFVKQRLDSRPQQG